MQFRNCQPLQFITVWLLLRFADVKELFNSVFQHGFGHSSDLAVDDFPIRGKSVKLHIKRRRWLDVKTNETLQRNWELVAKGTRMTQDFAEFLKKISLY